MSDNFKAILIWGVWALFAWITWFLTITDFKPPADVRANYIFWSLALALYSAIGVILFEDKIEGWVEFGVLGIVGVLCALYAYNVGYADGRKVTNHLLALWWGIVGTFSFGGATLATVCYGVAIREALDKRAAAGFNAQAQNDFEAFFDQNDDADFEFDPAGFSGGRSSGQNGTAGSDSAVPRGVDKRHPDDAKLWAVVDDPNAAVAERVKAMETIGKREAGRDVVKQ